MPTGTIAPKAPADPKKIRTAINNTEPRKTQAQVEKEAGIPVTLLSKYLNELRPIDWPTLTRLALVLGVPWKDLLVDECRTCHRKVAA